MKGLDLEEAIDLVQRQVVKIEEAFVAAGVAFEGGDGGPPLDVKAPPLVECLKISAAALEELTTKIADDSAYPDLDHALEAMALHVEQCIAIASLGVIMLRNVPIPDRVIRVIVEGLRDRVQLSIDADGGSIQ